MCLDSNPRPLVCESPIITTTPCLTPIVGELLANKINNLPVGKIWYTRYNRMKFVFLPPMTFDEFEIFWTSATFVESQYDPNYFEAKRHLPNNSVPQHSSSYFEASNKFYWRLMLCNVVRVTIASTMARSWVWD